MKLDRNINPNGRGKYALVNMRKLGPILDSVEAQFKSIAKGETLSQFVSESALKDFETFEWLQKRGHITLGNETPGDQFFVMKYKDRFTGPALLAYSQEALKWSGAHYDVIGIKPTKECAELIEYAGQIYMEYLKATFAEQRTPD